jgi:hypothetical protein
MNQSGTSNNNNAVPAGGVDKDSTEKTNGGRFNL